jgi:hypothetical protein
MAIMHLQTSHDPEAVPLSREYLREETERLRAREAELGIV